MNDFTKEELDELRASRCYHLDDNFPYEDALFIKLQSMIEKYCDHDSSDPLMALVKECNKCKQPIEHRRWELAQGWMKNE